MKITGKLSGKEYEVLVARYGFSYAVPLVLVPAKFLGFIPYHKRIELESHSEFFITAKAMHPAAMHRWFQKAVDQWELYESAWLKARQGGCQ